MSHWEHKMAMEAEVTKTDQEGRREQKPRDIDFTGCGGDSDFKRWDNLRGFGGSGGCPIFKRTILAALLRIGGRGGSREIS